MNGQRFLCEKLNLFILRNINDKDQIYMVLWVSGSVEYKGQKWRKYIIILKDHFKIDISISSYNKWAGIQSVFVLSRGGLIHG